MNILLLEDNIAIARSLGEYLEARHCRVDYAYTGRSCLTLAKENDYDVLVLDIAMPGLDGLQACKIMRTDMQICTPVIFLTARDTLDDKLDGFASGADDYLVKPFSPEELYCRLQALALRGPRRDIGKLAIGSLVIDHATQSVTRDNVPVKLTGLQFELLALLAKHSPDIVSRSTLEQLIWKQEAPSSDALRTHLYRLRNLVDKPFGKPMIKTIHSKGYRLDAD